MSDGIAFLDGRFVPAHEARISIFDGGFMGGDAVYDVVSVWKGWFFRLDDHLDRFLGSCARRRLTCPYPRPELARILAGCVVRAGLSDAHAQMTVTRGILSFTRLDPRLSTNQFLACAIPYVSLFPAEQQATGIHLAISGIRQGAADGAQTKTVSWLDLQDGLFEAVERGADAAVLVTSAGHLAEGLGFNLFVVAGHTLLTPRAGVVPGITRQTVLDLALEAGIAARQAELTPETLHGADEAFLSSTTGGIIPVTTVDGRPLGDGRPGPLTTRLRALYWSRREQGWLGTRVDELYRG